MLDLADGRLYVPEGFDEGEIEHSLDSLMNFQFPGPVSERFFWDNSFVSFIQGPYGSAKTTTCFFKLLHRANKMPICKDGVRRYRALVLRDTYRRMERTAIRSWHKWFPKTQGKWEGGQDRPSKHLLEFEDLDGVPLEFEIEFAAVGDMDIEDFMGGYEITDLMLNEVNLQTQEVLTYGSGRCGRFPSMKDLPQGSKFDYGVIGDLNAPEFDSWLLNMRFGELDPQLAHLGKTEFFLQPGGRMPDAENIKHLPEGYYDRLAAANAHQPWWVARMIDNKVGYSRNGKPVYEEYNDDIHCAREPLRLLPGVPLEFGFDGGYGLHPAGIVSQRTSTGQRRIVKEFYFDRCGPTRFAEQLKLWLESEARDIPRGRAFVDPTAFDGIDKLSGELGWVQIVEAATGLRMEPAPSNEPAIRQDAVRQELLYLIDGTQPSLLISPACVYIRKGFASHYRYEKVRKETGDEMAPKPAKNEYSHPHDGLQYLCLGSRGTLAVINRQNGARQQAPTGGCTIAKTSFSVFGSRP
ncbi:MAG: hypothetical protein ACRCS9_13905 [Hyphomicrobium sp.]